MAMKDKFELMSHRPNRKGGYDEVVVGDVYILPKRIGGSGRKFPVSVYMRSSIFEYNLRPKDLERFAVNILKALGSRKLKTK